MNVIIQDSTCFWIANTIVWAICGAFKWRFSYVTWISNI